MRAFQKMFLFAAIIGTAGCGAHEQQANAADSDLPHILHSVTTFNTGFPQSLYMYHVLDGAASVTQLQALSGTLSLENHSSNFSEVLWMLAYWQGECPADDQHLKNATIIWSDILKNPSLSKSSFPVDLHFPQPLPMTGCVGFVFGGGSAAVKGEVTMSADLNLTYQPSSSAPNTVVDLGGEYCFGQNWGCQNATIENDQGFARPITLPAGHLVELFGNISDSTFDGTNNFGPLPTGAAWGAVNEFYFLPGGCGKFGQNLNSRGFSKPMPMTTLRSWLPANAVLLESVPLEYQTAAGTTGKATLEQRVETLFSVPVTVNSGDCVAVIYGRNGNGATDNETQVKALMTP
ncbi:MAG TPA: hypothetical protein VKR59_16855 [Terriglobales bacterium]|nr:hypothetical protein [Terriglobales bacterium]